MVLRDLLISREIQQKSGTEKEGVIDGSHLESLLEAHHRETASTFGTRRPSRTSTVQALQAITSTVSESAQSDCDFKEDVSAWLSYNYWLHN